MGSQKHSVVLPRKRQTSIRSKARLHVAGQPAVLDSQFGWERFFYKEVIFFTKLFFVDTENQLDVNKFSGGKNEQFYTLNRLVAA